MRRFSPPVWFSLALCLASINFLSNTAVETSNVYMALYARSVGSSNLQVGLICRRHGDCFPGIGPRVRKTFRHSRPR